MEMGYISTHMSLKQRAQGSSLHKLDIEYKMSSRLKLARKLYIQSNSYDSLTGSPSGSEHESEDDGEYDIDDACEGCNMGDYEVVYEIGQNANNIRGSYDRRHA